jgi:hypothetical protein
LIASALKPADILGVFTPEGLCSGNTIIEDVNKGISIAAFGRDIINPGESGFIPGEEMRFKVFRSSINQECWLDVMFQPEFPDGEIYKDQGLSVAGSILLTNDNILSGKIISANIYPNPSHGIVELSLSCWPENILINIVDIRGNLIKAFTLGKMRNNEPYSIDLTDRLKGIYFLKIISNESITLKKVIIN